MARQESRAKDEAWAFVEREKKIDRFIKRVSIVAWAITLLIVLVFVVLTGMQLMEVARGVREGTLPPGMMLGVAIPLMVVLGCLSVLIATLSTIGIFLRLRTSSLAEIQLRLAALEAMLSSPQDSLPPPGQRG
jgi:hypothetical protein